MLRALVNDNVNGMTPIGIDTVTSPRLKGGKSNAMQGRVKKIMTGANVMLFQNKTVHGYDAMVKRRLIGEGKNPANFVLSPRKWGTRIAGTPFVTHNGNYYLECIFLSSGQVSYTLDDLPINVEDVTGLDRNHDWRKCDALSEQDSAWLRCDGETSSYRRRKESSQLRVEPT